MLESIYYGVLVVVGFSLIIFFHELGHFLAAKWAGVKVEQFAIGFGQAIVSWRKGFGVCFGATWKRIEKLKARGVDVSGYGETEYRFNWIPLGGYVKMLGQDDMDPNAMSNDPRSYNRAPVGKRMIIISAGVVMNVLLAGVLFTLLFLFGFRSPPAIVGAVLAGSPAQQAGLQTGDRLLTFNGEPLYDFGRIALHVALSRPTPTPVEFERIVDGKPQRMQALVTPANPRDDGFAGNILAIGVMPTNVLQGPAVFPEVPPGILSEQALLMRSGESIAEVDGVAVTDIRADYPLLDAAVQRGKPVALTLVNTEGQRRTVTLRPRLAMPFGNAPVSIAGVQPRTALESVRPDSSALNKLLPGDVIVQASGGGVTLLHPTNAELMQFLGTLGSSGGSAFMAVVRDGQTVEVEGLTPNIKVVQGRYGLGIGLGYDDDHAVVGDISPDSPADRAGLRKGMTILRVNGAAVASMKDVLLALRALEAGNAVLDVQTVDGQAAELNLPLDGPALKELRGLRFTHSLPLLPRYDERQTNSPLTATWWGVIETRDFLLQAYVTIQRMFEGSVPLSSMAGPVGIFNMGTRVAERGMDWFVWFLAMISANLAVLNFLPIPVVDGGHFVLLVIEKIKGKPLSQRTQAAIQYVGLVLLLSIFVFATYNDIRREWLW